MSLQGTFHSFLKLIVILQLAIFGQALSYESEKTYADPTEVPEELQNVGIDYQLGTQLDLGLTFKNESGDKVSLKEIMSNGKPTMLSLVYYSCGGLCNLHLNGVAQAMNEIKLDLGQDYNYVVVSFDPNNTPEMANSTKQAYVEGYKGGKYQGGWHFLADEGGHAAQLAKSVGFKYKWVESSGEWAHSAAAILVSPKGVVTNYLPGVYFEPGTLKYALIEASEGGIGTVIDQLALFCFQFDPQKSKYTIAAYRVMQAGGGFTVVLVAMWLFSVWVFQNKTKRRKG